MGKTLKNSLTIHIILLILLSASLKANDIGAIVGGLIVEDVTLNVPSDYSDINEALLYLDDKSISSSAYVTIQIADGTYSNYQTVYVSHTDGSQIKILGNASSPSNVVIEFASNQSGITCNEGSHLFSIDGVTLKGDGTGTGVRASRNSSLAMGANVIIDGFHTGINAVWGSQIVAGSGITIKNNGTHGVLANRATVLISNATVTNNGNGVYANSSSYIKIENGTISNNNYGIRSWQGSYVDDTGTSFSGNTTNSETAYSGVIGD